MKQITARVEITHNGQVITLEGTEAQTALTRLQEWNGEGSVQIIYTDRTSRQPQAIFLCCGDTWKRLPNNVQEVAEVPCTMCLPCNTGDEQEED